MAKLIKSYVGVFCFVFIFSYSAELFLFLDFAESKSGNADYLEASDPDYGRVFYKYPKPYKDHYLKKDAITSACIRAGMSIREVQTVLEMHYGNTKETFVDDGFIVVRKLGTYRGGKGYQCGSDTYVIREDDTEYLGFEKESDDGLNLKVYKPKHIHVSGPGDIKGKRHHFYSGLMVDRFS